MVTSGGIKSGSLNKKKRETIKKTPESFEKCIGGEWRIKNEGIDFYCGSGGLNAGVKTGDLISSQNKKKGGGAKMLLITPLED